MGETTARDWTPVSGWAGFPMDPRRIDDRADVRIMLCGERGQADVFVNQESRSAFFAAAEAYEVNLTKRPRACAGRNVTFLWAGPDHWTVVGDDPELAKGLARHFAGLAAVIDQSSSRAALRIGGSKARETLTKGVLIDLHPRSFQAGDVALTSIAHIGALLWQVDDDPTFEISVFRSMAESFWHWLQQSAAPFGFSIDRSAVLPG
jgi:heterotetrameric sarcosine oxidase gamma subunit